MLPKGVHKVKWTSGKVAYYWHPYRGTPKAGKMVRLPDDPASVEFWQALEALQKPVQPDGGMARMIDAYMASPHFLNVLKPSTRREYVRYMSTLREALKAFEPDQLQPMHIAEFRDSLGETPSKANAYIRAISALYRWGMERGFATKNPAYRITKFKGDEYKPWPDWAWQAAIEHFREEIRVACYLGRYTGQRLGDVLRMKLSDIGAEGIEVQQEKTGKPLTIPLRAALLPIVAECRRRGRIFLVSRPNGQPFTVDQFHAMWGREMKRSDELRKIRDAGLSFHGLRKLAAVELAHAGVSGSGIGAITGQTLQTVQHYTRGADQKRLAKGATKQVEGGDQ